jgi:hypothetical protein
MIPERAGARRERASAVSGITRLRINPPGEDAALVNMSPTGLLAESPAKQRVGTPVEVHFYGGFTPASITGRVVRCEVAIMEHNGLLRYHIAIEFDSLIELADEDKAAEAVPPQPAKTVRNRW